MIRFKRKIANKMTKPILKNNRSPKLKAQTITKITIMLRARRLTNLELTYFLNLLDN